MHIRSRSSQQQSILSAPKRVLEHDHLSQTSATSIKNDDVEDWHLKALRAKIRRKQQSIDLYAEELQIKEKELNQRLQQKKDTNEKILQSLRYLVEKENQYTRKLQQQLSNLNSRPRQPPTWVPLAGQYRQSDLNSVSFSFCQ